ncbi:MAG: histidine--tRNA ligase [Candidatus Paceibacterota bacterium]
MPKGKKESVSENQEEKISENDDLQTVKGARDLIGDQVFLFQGFFEKAAEIALYYGFKPIETPILEKESLFSRGVGNSTDIVEKEMYSLKTRGGDKLVLRPEGTAAVMRAYFEHGFSSRPQPVMFYYHGPFFRHEKPQQGRWRQFYQFGLEVLGTKKSITDAMIIRLTMLILKEAGLTDLTVKINSLGDADCLPIYRRELSAYYRKNLRKICVDCRERLKHNPLRVLDCKNPKCQEIKQEAPESLGYLCAPCKKHFKEVLEYLDMMNINYEIDNTLVRGLDYYTHTVFEIFYKPPASTAGQPAAGTSDIDSADQESIGSSLAIASGGRYDILAKVLSGKKEVPAVGASIGVDRVIALPQYAKHPPRLMKNPKVFFIQLSFDAKLKSFEVIEILRTAKVPVAQSLSKDSLGAQLSVAEKLKVPYAIILGQREAVDNTVIVRNMENRSQDTIPIGELAAYLKKIK